MLSEIFGMEWYEIHEEAERLEHAVSPAFELKLREKAGRERGLPARQCGAAGDPAERKKRGEIPFSEAAEGENYTVISLHERDPKLLLFLHRAGVGPGKSMKVLRQNYDQTVSIQMDTGSSILGRPAAEAVWLVSGAG